jgi:hypothetical protein
MDGYNTHLAGFGHNHYRDGNETVARDCFNDGGRPEGSNRLSPSFRQFLGSQPEGDSI